MEWHKQERRQGSAIGCGHYCTKKPKVRLFDTTLFWAELKYIYIFSPNNGILLHILEREGGEEAKREAKNQYFTKTRSVVRVCAAVSINQSTFKTKNSNFFHQMLLLQHYYRVLVSLQEQLQACQHVNDRSADG